jgi:hypothetical protein
MGGGDLNPPYLSRALAIVTIKPPRIYNPARRPKTLPALIRSRYVQKERDIAATTAPMAIPASTSLG